MKLAWQVLAVALTQPVTAFVSLSTSSGRHQESTTSLVRRFVAKDPPPLFGTYVYCRMELFSSVRGSDVVVVSSVGSTFGLMIHSFFFVYLSLLTSFVARRLSS